MRQFPPTLRLPDGDPLIQIDPRLDSAPLWSPSIVQKNLKLIRFLKIVNR